EVKGPPRGLRGHWLGAVEHQGVHVQSLSESVAAEFRFCRFGRGQGILVGDKVRSGRRRQKRNSAATGRGSEPRVRSGRPRQKRNSAATGREQCPRRSTTTRLSSSSAVSRVTGCCFSS